MDIWELPAGHQVDLGPAREPGEHDRPAGLGLASRLLALLDERLAGTSGAVLADLVWYPDRGDTTRLRLVITDTGRRIAGLRLLAVDRHGTTRPILDARLRRGTQPSTWDEPAMLAEPVRRGDAIHRRFTVDAGRLTDHVPGARPLLTTPDLIAWLEDTAADLLRPRLAPGTSSVGTWIGVRHTGPAWLDDRVDVRAVCADVLGRRYLFDVLARVGERAIADGQVAQTLIRAPR